MAVYSIFETRPPLAEIGGVPGQNRTGAQGLGIFPNGIYAVTGFSRSFVLVSLYSASGLVFIYPLLLLAVSFNGLLHPVVWSYCGYGMPLVSGTSRAPSGTPGGLCA